MSKKQTKCIDYCICPYCGYKFDGNNALNANMDSTSTTCPDCSKDMSVSVSVEYMCTELDD